jgi:hypothetical protein
MRDSSVCAYGSIAAFASFVVPLAPLMEPLEGRDPSEAVLEKEGIGRREDDLEFEVREGREEAREEATRTCVPGMMWFPRTRQGSG